MAAVSGQHMALSYSMSVGCSVDISLHSFHTPDYCAVYSALGEDEAYNVTGLYYEGSSTWLSGRLTLG